jgi:hypothetical protein
MHYRKIWEQYTGQAIAIDYEIHHIDGDHNNNAIHNLMCVSIEEHLNIHQSQEDWGAVQAILMRMKDKCGISEASSKHQLQLIAKGEHNFQKEEVAQKRKVSLQNDMKKRLEAGNGSFLGITNAKENSSNAGKACFSKKKGFFDPDKHGSKYVIGTYWWVNSFGERMRASVSPGENWKRGMKYES